MKPYIKIINHYGISFTLLITSLYPIISLFFSIENKAPENTRTMIVDIYRDYYFYT